RPPVCLVARVARRESEGGRLPRGMIFAASGLAQLAGLYLAGRRTRTWFEKAPGEPLRRAGFIIAFVGLGQVIIAVAPTMALAIPATLANYFVFGFFYPPFLATQAL